MYKQNESQPDKNIRMSAGVILLAVGLFFLTGALKTAAVAAGVLALATGISGFCPLYRLLGIRTKK